MSAAESDFVDAHGGLNEGRNGGAVGEEAVARWDEMGTVERLQRVARLARTPTQTAKGSRHPEPCTLNPAP